MSEPSLPSEPTPPSATPPPTAGNVAPPANPAPPATVPVVASAVLPVTVPDSLADRPGVLLIGGLFGFVGCAIGLLLLVLACAGMDAALKLSYLPMGLGLVGFFVTLAGAVAQKSKLHEETHVLASLFACCLGIIGGLVEMTAWLGWPTMR